MSNNFTVPQNYELNNSKTDDVYYGMKALFLILMAILSMTVAAQTILNSPYEAKDIEDIDYRNIKWTEWQDPHYYSGYDPELLNQDMYLEADAVEAGEVLFEKINIYREIMGKNRLVLNDTGSFVCRQYAKELATRHRFTHTLWGQTPTDRMKPYFPYTMEASENLNHYGCTIHEVNETVDEFTDLTLHCWINSKGHNTNLLNDGKIGAIGFYTHIDEKKNSQSTIAVFSILYRR